MGPIKAALSLLIMVVFSLYIYVLLMRVLMQKVGMSWRNPVTQFVLKITNPVVMPLRRFIPGFKGFDLSIIVVAFILELFSLWLLLWMKVSVMPGIMGSIVVAIAQLGSKITTIYIWTIIIGALMSWFPQMQNNPVTEIIHRITEPPLSLARRFIPLVGGIDISPIPVILVLMLINILILNPLTVFGTNLAFG